MELIKIETRDIGGVATKTCNGRELWTFIQSGQEFANWIKGRVATYGFVEGTDYVVDKFVNNPKGGRPTLDYHLTLDMAKELGMVENNDKGREIRRYFIACEKQTLTHGVNPSLEPARITPAQAQKLKELVHLIVETEKQNWAETWARLQRKFQVNSYLQLPAAKFDEACRYLGGKMDDSDVASLVNKHLVKVEGRSQHRQRGSLEAVGKHPLTLPRLTAYLDTLGSHAEFARKIGVDDSYLWRLQHGIKKIGMKMMERIIVGSNGALTPADLCPERLWVGFYGTPAPTVPVVPALSAPAPMAALPTPNFQSESLAALSLRGAVFQMDALASAKLAEIIDLAEIAIKFFPAAVACLEPIRVAASKARDGIGFTAELVGCSVRR